jgi:hypothetical protein
MLFWLFIIIGAAALIGAFVVRVCSPTEDNLKDARDAAMRAWEISIQTHQRTEVISECQNAYYAADHALDEYRKSNRTKEKVCNGFAITLFVIAVVAAIAIFISSIVLLLSYATAGGERARLEVEYETLSWEVENQVYHDGGDDVVGKKELYNQVREWNKNLASNQYYEKNFWVGIFYPDIYGDLKFIELK